MMFLFGLVTGLVIGAVLFCVGMVYAYWRMDRWHTQLDFWPWLVKQWRDLNR